MLSSVQKSRNYENKETMCPLLFSRFHRDASRQDVNILRVCCVSPTFITRTSLLLKCCYSAGELIAARYCSPRPPSTANPPPPLPPPFFLVNPCPCLACLFLSKIVSQAGRTGRQRKRDNMDRKGWEQQPRWTGSGVHCLV